MDRKILRFSEYVNEEVNFVRSEGGMCQLNERWFFYNQEDDIIYGSDDKPVGDGILFAFNPVSCTVITGGDETKYDVNNPVCLIHYDMKKERVSVYSENASDMLESIGFSGGDITSSQSANRIQDVFEKYEDDRYILIYGKRLVASTFDVIEEND